MYEANPYEPLTLDTLKMAVESVKNLKSAGIEIVRTNRKNLAEKYNETLKEIMTA